MNDVCRALIGSDVNIAMVKKLRTNVLASIETNLGSGVNKQRLIQKASFYWLTFRRSSMNSAR